MALATDDSMVLARVMVCVPTSFILSGGVTNVFTVI